MENLSSQSSPRQQTRQADFFFFFTLLILRCKFFLLIFGAWHRITKNFEWYAYLHSGLCWNGYLIHHSSPLQLLKCDQVGVRDGVRRKDWCCHRGAQAWRVADVAHLLSSVSPLPTESPMCQTPECPPEWNTPWTGVRVTPGLLLAVIGETKYLKEAIRNANKSAVNKHTSYFSLISILQLYFLINPLR